MKYRNRSPRYLGKGIRLTLILGLLFFAGSLLAACGSSKETTAIDTSSASSQTTANQQAEEYQTMNIKKKTIYLAGGCFWGVEAYFQRIPGIISTEVGYANGNSDETDYHRIAGTGHAETAKIVYNAHAIHLAEILDRYYLIIDPLSLNRQGNDVGTQYRVGIYYDDEADQPLIELSLSLLAERLGQESVIELQPLKNYVSAEDYHQDYLNVNPTGYCHINLNLSEQVLFPGREKPSDDKLRQELSDLSYRVTQKDATEAPFSSPYDKFDEPGIYVDIVTGQPLFSSVDKYDAGCGWPSFTQPITTDVILYSEDRSLGRVRTEVETKEAQNHLGHVFSDGPTDAGGLRYCINGASLTFIPYDQMRKLGYAQLLPYVTK